MKLKSFAIASLLGIVALSAFASEERCGPHELTASLQLATPSYSDAMLLKQDLTDNGFGVECVLESKWGGMFHDSTLGYRTSGALFRTSLGDFDVVFLPAPHGFDQLEVNESRNGRFYDYSFGGYPVTAAHVESGGRTYFVKRGNKLFVVNYADLAAVLAKVPLR
jgi:hypothetical protein